MELPGVEWLSTIVLTVIVASLSFIYWRRGNYPDGPFSFPIIGNLPQIILCGGDISAFAEKYKKIYGNVYTFEIGGLKRVVISGYDTLQYVMISNNDKTSNRSADSFAGFHEDYYRKYGGLGFSKENIWKPTRHLTQNVFRREGIGKAMMEPKVMAEVENFDQYFIQPNVGKPIDISFSMTFATANVTRQVLVGERYDYDDEELHKLNEAIREVIATWMRGGFTRNIPFMKYLPFDFTGAKANERAGRYALSVVRKWMTNARPNVDSDHYNFILQALRTQGTEKQRDGKAALYLSDEMLTSTVYQIYTAGLDTSSTAIKWACIYVTIYPKVQELARQEVLKFIGERKVSMKDRTSMPYIDALIYETFRHSNMVPEGLPHTLDEDLIVEGKKIPAGTDLMLNFASVHWNPEIFPEPEKFKPERFLGEDGADLKSKIISFGFGRRSCLGKSLAWMEVFFFIVTFLQKYSLSYPADDKPTLEAVADIVRTPVKCKLIFNKL